MKHFSNLEDYHDYLGLPKPLHSQLSIVVFDPDEPFDIRKSSPSISTDLYTIKLKWDRMCELVYGRTRYDFSSGSLIFVAPGQTVGWDQSADEVKQNGIMLMLHKDYLAGHEIERRFKKAACFSYAVHEALHLSEREEDIIKQIIVSINDEYQGDADEHSKEIIMAHLSSLLRYATRYYQRQFKNRKEINSHIASRFQAVLSDYFELGKSKEAGLPNIDMIAEQLAVSPRYLSDSLKAETGKTAMEHLQLYLIEEAKSLLLAPSITISEVAYQLGFEYPQYFSRMFRKRTGLSPKQYQMEHC